MLMLLTEPNQAAAAAVDPWFWQRWGIYVQIAGPIVGAIVGVLAIKLWERARPLAFAESFDARVRSDERLGIGEELYGILDRSMQIQTPATSQWTVGELHRCFGDALGFARLCKQSLADMAELRGKAKAASDLAAATEFVSQWLRFKVNADMVPLALIRDEIRMPEPPTRQGSPAIEVRKVEANEGAFAAKFGPGFYQFGQQLNDEWAHKRQLPLADAIAWADVSALASLTEQVEVLLRSQLELHRKICSLARPLLVDRMLIGATVVIANRGSGLAALRPRAEIQLRTRSGASCRVPCTIEIPLNASDKIVLKKIRSVAIVSGGQSLAAIVATESGFGSLTGASEVIAAAKRGEAEGRVRVRFVGIFNIERWVSTPWSSFNFKGEDIASIEIP